MNSLRYPDVEALAVANADDLRTWFRPFGLIQRADNLVKTAKTLLSEHRGKVPKDLESLLALPGIGLYSARAILSICYNVRVPMVDESSGRLLRRMLGKRRRGPAYCDIGLLKSAGRLLPVQRCKEFNLGLLDIAAQYCGPSLTVCAECPLKPFCSHAQRSERAIELGKRAHGKL